MNEIKLCHFWNENCKNLDFKNKPTLKEAAVDLHVGPARCWWRRCWTRPRPSAPASPSSHCLPAAAAAAAGSDPGSDSGSGSAGDAGVVCLRPPSLFSRSGLPSGSAGTSPVPRTPSSSRCCASPAAAGRSPWCPGCCLRGSTLWWRQCSMLTKQDGIRICFKLF